MFQSDNRRHSLVTVCFLKRGKCLTCGMQAILGALWHCEKYALGYEAQKGPGPEELQIRRRCASVEKESRASMVLSGFPTDFPTEMSQHD